MPDSTDIKNALINRLVSGVSKKAIGDKSWEYLKPAEVLDAVKDIAADEQVANGPFVKVGFYRKSFS